MRSDVVGGHEAEVTKSREDNWWTPIPWAAFGLYRTES